jgi:hypothetical protein
MRYIEQLPKIDSNKKLPRSSTTKKKQRFLAPIGAAIDKLLLILIILSN